MNAAADRLDDSYPHGTVEGYRRGCRGGVCPAGEQHGLSCRRAGQLHAGDYRYQKLAKRGLTPAEIADELGLVPETNAAPAPKPSRPAKPEPAPAEPEPASPSEDASQNEEPTMSEPTQPTEPTETPAADTAAPAIPSQSVIRAWARANGIEVNPRGSVQKGVLNAYLRAHRTTVESAPDATEAPVEIEEATPAPNHAADAVDPAASAEPDGSDKPEPVVLIRDFARNSDILDETRRRLGMEEHPSSWVPSQEVVPDRIRPDWADVAVSHDVEQARSIAARLEAENAILLEQLTTVSSSLEFALRQWAAATDRATAAEHHKIGAQLRALDAEEQRDTANTALAETTVELNDALARVALLESQVAIAQPAVTPIRRMFGNVR